MDRSTQLRGRLMKRQRREQAETPVCLFLGLNIGSRTWEGERQEVPDGLQICKLAKTVGSDFYDGKRGWAAAHEGHRLEQT